MCGIAGFTNPGPDARDILAWMNAALGHRGPDSSGIAQQPYAFSAIFHQFDHTG